MRLEGGEGTATVQGRLWLAVTGPMAPGRSGTTCWPRGPHAGCTVSSGRCVSRLCGQDHAAEPEVDRRLHLSLDSRRVALRGDRLSTAVESAGANDTAVVGLFSRRVVSWSMSATMAAQLVADALNSSEHVWSILLLH
jgi:hypothetical protein